MTFLSPGLLAALLPLLGLPLVLHLLNKGVPRGFKFPSIELIKETLTRRSRVHRWRHWILLLLRTAFLLLLLLAFLRPTLKQLGFNPADTTGRHVLIVLDHSLSMEDKGDGPTSRERGVHEALELIASLRPDDEINVLLMEPDCPTCFTAFSRDTEQARRFLNQLKPGLGRADVNLAGATAARLLGQATVRPEVYYISDFTRKKWADANFKMLPPAAKLFFVDAGPSHRDNRAILDARVSQAEILAGDTVPLEVSVGNYSEEAFTGRVTVSVDKKFNVDQEVSIAPWSEGKFTVPVAVGGPGVHRCEVQLPGDALEYDNHFALTLSALEKEEVVIAADGAAGPKSGAYYLKTALNPFADDAGSLLPRIIPSRELTASRLAGVSKLFFTHVDRLTADEAGVAANFLFRGGGLVYFLDGPADAENLAALEKLIGAGAMPMRLARRNVATNVTAGAQQIARGDFKSPYLRLFQGDGRQNLALLEFYDFYQAAATSAGGVLLEYGDGSPAMGAAHYGLGVLLILNFSADEQSSNLARQRIFPAWVQDLAKAVSTTEPAPSSYVIGDTLRGEIWRTEMRLDLLSPNGTAVQSRREVIGERCSLSFKPEQLGFYTLGSPKPAYAFAVNAAAEQSDLRPMDKTLLPAEFAGSHEARLVAGGDEYDSMAHGRRIFQWFVVSGVALLVVETAFQTLIRRRTA